MNRADPFLDRAGQHRLGHPARAPGRRADVGAGPGDAVGLSASAAAERRRRLEEAGVLRGYRAEVDLEAAGFPVQAVLRVNIPGARYDRINQLLPKMPEVYHCLRVAGEDCYVLLVRATSIPHLDTVASRLATTGAVTTNVVYETVVDNRPVERPG